jgi:hypothetical protein
MTNGVYFLQKHFKVIYFIQAVANCKRWYTWVPYVIIIGSCPISFWGTPDYLKNAVFWNVASCRYCVNRRFGGKYRVTEMSVHTGSTRCYNPEDGILHSHRRENLESYIWLSAQHFSCCIKTKFYYTFWKNIVQQNHAVFEYSIKLLAKFSAVVEEICNKLKKIIIGSAVESTSHRKYIITKTLYCYGR